MRCLGRILVVIFCCISTRVWAQENSALEQYFKNYLEQAFAMRPMDASSLGDHRFDGQLDDISAEARTQWLSQWKSTLEDLPKQIAFDSLSPIEQVDYYEAVLDHGSVPMKYLPDLVRQRLKLPR